MLDRRSDPRERVIYGGIIATDAKNAKIDCVVRNLSGSGANIELASSEKMPENFNIAIPKTGRSFLAKIVWWRANRAGLEFQTTAAGSGNPVSFDLEERLRISEKKARALKQRVRQLLGES
ncbi:MAG: PilZ domain-containing protein [Afipia sp.]|nr:PilZ domain-containing protein [Afipia sp.]